MTNLNGVCLCVFCVVLQNKRVFEVYRVSDCLVLFAGFFCPNTLQGCPMWATPRWAASGIWGLSKRSWNLWLEIEKSELNFSACCYFNLHQEKQNEYEWKDESIKEQNHCT